MVAAVVGGIAGALIGRATVRKRGCRGKDLLDLGWVGVRKHSHVRHGTTIRAPWADVPDCWSRSFRGIARSMKSGTTQSATPRLFMCPTCGFSTCDLKKTIWSSVYVVRCDECRHVSCAMCGQNSFWTGAKCPKCTSRRVARIGRIKDAFDPPTLMEDLEDRRF